MFILVTTILRRYEVWLKGSGVVSIAAISMWVMSRLSFALSVTRPARPLLR